MIRIINKTEFGIVFKCEQCNKIHLVYNNMSLNFSDEEYFRFAEYISTIDGDYWAEKNSHSMLERKICIPVASSSKICLVLHPDELTALKELLEVPLVQLWGQNMLEIFSSSPSLN